MWFVWWFGYVDCNGECVVCYVVGLFGIFECGWFWLDVVIVVLLCDWYVGCVYVLMYV